MGVSTSEWPQVEERVTVMPGSHHHQQHQPQHNNLHLHGATAGASSVTTTAAAGRAMDNQQALKCPRCDSSNTKFCYYNNYSLSQPRHFCKACKRYWTRGGTLRNVPVGGGCRKNKRIKRTSSTSGAATDSPSLPRQISNVSLLQSSSTTVDPIFYGLIHNNSGDLNRAADFPSLLKRLEQRNLMCNLNSCTDLYDFNPQLGSLGLFFPTTTTAATTHQDFNAVQFHTPDLSTAALVTTTASTSLVHDYSLLGSSLSSSTATSLLAAGFRPQPKMGAVNNPSGWVDIQGAEASANVSSGLFKEEDGANVLSHEGRLEWQIPCENSQLNDVGAVDGMSLYWNVNAAAGVGGGWTETATNCGSSIAPLI